MDRRLVTASLSDPVSKHLHEAVLRDVNFEYLYDFAFAPEKLRGVPYAPLGPPAQVSQPAAEEAGALQLAGATDPSGALRLPQNRGQTTAFKGDP